MRLYLVFERWEEERYPEGIKWKFLEHKGPVFAPPYEPLPESVKFYYDGELFQGCPTFGQEKSQFPSRKWKVRNDLVLYHLFCFFFHFVLLSSCGSEEGSSGIYLIRKGPFGAEKVSRERG